MAQRVAHWQAFVRTSQALLERLQQDTRGDAAARVARADEALLEALPRCLTQACYDSPCYYYYRLLLLALLPPDTHGVPGDGRRGGGGGRAERAGGALYAARAALPELRGALRSTHCYPPLS